MLSLTTSRESFRTMATSDVDYILGNLLPDWPKTPPDPPGNYYASELKKIHDFSKEVLPQSRHGDERSQKVRWTSHYKSDFIPLLEFKEKENSPKSAPVKQKDKPTSDSKPKVGVITSSDIQVNLPQCLRSSKFKVIEIFS